MQKVRHSQQGRIYTFEVTLAMSLDQRNFDKLGPAYQNPLVCERSGKREGIDSTLLKFLSAA